VGHERGLQQEIGESAQFDQGARGAEQPGLLLAPGFDLRLAFGTPAGVCSGGQFTNDTAADVLANEAVADVLRPGVIAATVLTHGVSPQ
jgi:hypothetical protein